MQTLGFGLVMLGFFLFLLSLFSVSVFPYIQWEGSFSDPWSVPSGSFYSGIGFVIVGAALLNTARNRTIEKGMASSVGIRDNLSRRIQLSHFPIDVGIGLMAGIVAAGANTFAAWAPSLGSNGFPFPVRVPIPGCFGPGGLLGCSTYDSWALVLDGALWAGLAFVTVAFTDLITTRFAHGLGKRVGYRSQQSTV